MKTSTQYAAQTAAKSHSLHTASRWMAIGVLSGLLLGLAGCNTMAGAGQDISRGGQDLTHSAENNK